VDLSSRLRRFLWRNHCWCIGEPSHRDYSRNLHPKISDFKGFLKSRVLGRRSFDLKI
jgi:hypothetical protein